jgi:hypothetical protein
MNMESGSRESDNSQVFLVRLWTGPAATPNEAATEARSIEGDGTWILGKVTHLPSGKGSSFMDWPDLLALLMETMLSQRA